MAGRTRHISLVLTPVKVEPVQPGQNVGSVIIRALRKQNVHLRTGYVIAIPSKVVSISQGRIVRLGEVNCSKAAERLGKKWCLDKRLAQIVMNESDLILGGVKGFILTIKQNILTANAGVDSKNSPPGTVTLWPENPYEAAANLRSVLEKQYMTKLGVEIVDSRVTPLRLGTTGLAIGLSGFVPVRDERGKHDLYGRVVKVTRTNIADDIAASAHLLMGETDERIGAVVVARAPIRLTEEPVTRCCILPINKCLLSSNLAAIRRLSFDF